MYDEKSEVLESFYLSLYVFFISLLGSLTSWMPSYLFTCQLLSSSKGIYVIEFLSNKDIIFCMFAIFVCHFFFFLHLQDSLCCLDLNKLSGECVLNSKKYNFDVQILMSCFSSHFIFIFWTGRVPGPRKPSRVFCSFWSGGFLLKRKGLWLREWMLLSGFQYLCFLPKSESVGLLRGLRIQSIG